MKYRTPCGDHSGWATDSRSLPVESLVGVVGEPHHPFRDGVGAASVLVDPGPGIEARRRDVAGTTVGRSADDHISPALGGPLLHPVGVVTVELDQSEADRASDDQVGRDRRAPGAEWGRLRLANEPILPPA